MLEKLVLTTLLVVGAARGARAADPDEPGVCGVIVEPGMVSAEQVTLWKADRINAVAVVLDDAHNADAYAAAAKAASGGGVDLYYWIEVGRNPSMAERHPEWVATLGMHHDWKRSFPDTRLPQPGEVARAFPWVPITHREAFDAHLDRVETLLKTKAATPYAGLLLNDLQGGPASCGCGNLQCRWATDYRVPSTATRLEGDDVAARFVAEVRKRAAGKAVIPIWTTECEDIDLPAKLAPGGKTTGLSGEVPCATATCPKVFTRQLDAVLAGYDGPVGLLALREELERDAAHGFPGDFAPVAVRYCDTVPAANGGRTIPHQRMWLVTQGKGLPATEQAAARRSAASLGVGGVFQSLVALDQSYQPRLAAAK